MRLLGCAIVGSGWHEGTLSWVPLEERELVNEPEANAPTRVTVGRGGSLDILACSTDPSHEHSISIR